MAIFGAMERPTLLRQYVNTNVIYTCNLMLKILFVFIFGLIAVILETPSPIWKNLFELQSSFIEERYKVL